MSRYTEVRFSNHSENGLMDIDRSGEVSRFDNLRLSLPDQDTVRASPAAITTPPGTVIVSNSASRSPNDVYTNQHLKEYFANREGAVEGAIEDCAGVILGNLDGAHLGSWLLTEIDHWDREKERLVFLTTYSLIVLKYDFIALKLLEYRRLHLKAFDRVQIGSLVYPQNSLMSMFGRRRNRHGAMGVRCTWNAGVPLPIYKTWNPFCEEIPFVTFTSHPLEPKDSRRFCIQSFSAEMERAVQTLDLSKAPPSGIVKLGPCQVSHEDIVVESYLGVAAAFHNMASLGFFKNRGKLSF